VRAVATSQQGGYSGQIPGTSSDPTQVAVQFSTIQQYPPSAPSPNGDQVAGVGHAVLNNAGNPVVVMGNLNATQTSGTDLPSNFQDGGFAFLDAAGNLVAGYSQETGLWGFGGSTTAQFYLFGASAAYLGGFQMPLKPQPPSKYFASGIDYNGQDRGHDAFGNRAENTALWMPYLTGLGSYASTNPICLVYGGPTDPSSISGASASLNMTAWTPSSGGGYTLLADGTATPTGWTYQPSGNIGPYTGLWMTYNGSVSSLSWSWNTSPISPLTYNSDGSFTSTADITVLLSAEWSGNMS
jgi:hypothetical protein